jgi:hypothetical protein
MNLIHSKQTKLTATALNNVAVAFVIAGFVGPIMALGYGPAAMPSDVVAIVVSIIWLSVGFVLHVIAKLVLRDLKP